MKQSKGSPVKLPGQRSISSSFIFRSSSIHSKSSEREEDDKEKRSSGHGNRVSLSEFLNRKLNQISAPSKKIPGKERPFSFPASCEDLNGSMSSENEIKNGREEISKSVLDESVFRRFKHTVRYKGNSTSSCTDVQELKKRRGSIEGGDIELPAKKKLLVIGDDPESDRMVKKEKFGSNKQPRGPRPFYNHYANGGGWWGCDMEGVDNDEVGHNEIWEGIGSTTLGGLDWH